MQRLFSAFPGGAPGVGILGLRAAAAGTVIWAAAAGLTRASDPPLAAWAIGITAIAMSICVLIGAITPPASLLLGLIVAVGWVRFPDATSIHTPGALLLVSDAVALALIGPGAFSVDARLFGRRKIVLTRRTPPPTTATGIAD